MRLSINGRFQGYRKRRESLPRRRWPDWWLFFFFFSFFCFLYTWLSKKVKSRRSYERPLVSQSSLIFRNDAQSCHGNRPCLIITVSKQTKDVGDGNATVITVFSSTRSPRSSRFYSSPLSLSRPLSLVLSLFAVIQPVTPLFYDPFLLAYSWSTEIERDGEAETGRGGRGGEKKKKKIISPRPEALRSIGAGQIQ